MATVNATDVIDGDKNQKEINDGIQNLQELIEINTPRQGQRLFVKGLQGGWFEYNNTKANVNDGVVTFNGWVRVSLEIGVKPEWAGAKRNGVDDDAFAIRKVIEYCKNNVVKRILFTKGDNPYVAGSIDINNSAFSISQSNIYLDFETPNTEIKATIPMSSILYFSDSVYRFRIENGVFNCNNLADYGINTLSTVYTPQLKINSLTIERPLIDGVYIQTFIADITMLSVNGGQRGIVIRPTAGNITTSINLKSCYIRNQTVCSYDISIACYCALIACATDHTPLAYKINARGCSMIACGAEDVEKLAEFTSFRGLSINGFYSQRCGSKDPTTPTLYLMEFVTGRDATLSGFHIDGVRYYTYKIGITSPNFGTENLHITDGSVRRSEAYFVPNFTYTRPIRFAFDDSTQKNLIVNISNIEELRKFISTYLDNYHVNHKLTLQLADGIYNFDLVVSVINTITGGGEVCMQGNPASNNKVVLQTDFKRLLIKNCKATIRLKDLTISASNSNGYNERLNVDNSQAVYLDNVLITKSGQNVGVGVRATNGSIIYITNGTIADSTSFVNGIFIKDNTSKFIMDSSTSIPLTLNWSSGMLVENSNPIANIGWVFSGNTWKTYGAIS
ncbi:hypothetical protein [Acinetobacter sp. YK3]|uniref:hypothetical protein n=1 Tax=Acinetobacter sp. YK3 TaxID=1860097 RepID=UPI00084BF8D5|nr:hypothetical protein [Acinetobacter sp. YK3]OEC84807.1 hypothetical protein A9Z07_13440 [Acinetobacter sp. YK3]